VGSVVVGRRSFAIDFPFRPLLKIGLATLIMIGVLRLARFPPTALGLCALIVLGAATYAAAALALDVAGARSALTARWTAKDAPS
jgi:hypothetical protein